MSKTLRQIIQYDEQLGHKYVPNLTARLKYGNGGYLIRTDKNGFRNSPNQAAGKLKIIALGDSYTAGDGVTNDSRFCDLLMNEFDCEVINLAVSGYGVDQQILAYEQYKDQIEHDLIIFLPHLDDLKRNLLFAREGIDKNSQQQIKVPKPYFELKDGELILKNIPVPREREAVEAKTSTKKPKATKDQGFLKSKLKSLKHKADQFVRYQVKKQVDRPELADPKSPEWEMMAALIQRLKSLAGDRKVPCFPLPYNSAIVNKEEAKHISIFKTFADDQFKVNDISDSLIKNFDPKNNDIFLPICGHFADGGHRVLKDNIGRAVKEVSDLQARGVRSKPRQKHTYVMGISCFYHDSAAAILKDGKVIAAAQEERFTRVKHDKAFPGNAINYCLEAAEIDINQLTAFVYYDDETWTIERVLHNAKAIGDNGEAFWNMAKESLYKKLRLPAIIRKNTGYEGNIFKTQHHVSHAASAFYPSEYDEAAILVVDGVGEWACSTIAVGKGKDLKVLKQQFYPHSLGLLYSAFTYFTGFKVNSGEYKLMGLAPYGKPVYADKIKAHLIDLKEDGSIELDLSYFSFQEGEKMTNDKFAQLFDGPARPRESRITRREMDLASSIQKVTEEVVVNMAIHAHELTGKKNLVMAGGVALNCVANGYLFDETPFENIYFQPAAGDAGGALGCAMSWYFQEVKNASRQAAITETASLGPEFSNEEVYAFLHTKGLPFNRFEKEKRAETIAKFIADKKVIGYFDGRMEFGPRALGNRSILGNPLDPESQSKLNLKIKFRESFRPFAPIYAEERTKDYFDFDRPSPYMLIVRKVNDKILKPVENTDSEDLISIVNQERSEIPAITHVDNSARLQSVNAEQNEGVYKAIKAFGKETGKEVLINTSFNVRGEPIVCTPLDAFKCFMRTHMDVLVLNDYFLLKTEQAEWEDNEDWMETFELD